MRGAVPRGWHALGFPKSCRLIAERAGIGIRSCNSTGMLGYAERLGQRGAVCSESLAHPTPNYGLQPTASSVRSCLVLSKLSFPQVHGYRPLCGEGKRWPITRPGAVQKPDAVTVCNKGEGYATMTTVQDGPGATCSCLPMSSMAIRKLTPQARLCSHTVPVSFTHQLCKTETLICETSF
jgi:hypothetical protein